MNGHKSRELRTMASTMYSEKLKLLGVSLRQFYRKIKKQYIKGGRYENIN